jgi:hypothetical protein
MSLTIKDYNKAEIKALPFIPTALQSAFQPVTFEKYGYPTRIHSEKEIIKFADHNSESEVSLLYLGDASFPPAGYINRFSEDEKNLSDKIRVKVSKAIYGKYKRPLKPCTSLLIQFAAFRVLCAIQKQSGKSPLQIFEIGPGLGYLGALLALLDEKFIYSSFDITQSLYLWQNFLFANLIKKQNFLEKAHTLKKKNAINIHYPWWEYLNLNPCQNSNYDIIYSNSNLGEMTRTSLKYIARKSAAMLKDSNIGAFIFFSLGNPAQNSKDDVHEALKAEGFHLLFESPFFCYALRSDSNLPAIFNSGKIPIYNPLNKTKFFTANEMMALKREESPIDLEFTAWFHKWSPPFI